MATVTRLYDNYDEARRAVTDLVAAGIPDSDISLVARNLEDRQPAGGTMVDADRDGHDDRGEAASSGAGIGALLGGGAGLLAGLGIMAIPGIGPVVAAGWLASTALGAAVGGAAGGIIGALTEAGVSEEDAHVYAEGVRRGGTLITARVPDARRGEIEALLAGYGTDAATIGNTYRGTGWSGFDPAAPELTPEEIRRERERNSRIV
ncbi:MAG: hypothetical protein AB7F78_11510 [Hyphomicrobiaceae bacterium]